MADGSIYTGKEDELVEYFLMRKDEAVTLCEVAEDGTMVAYAKTIAILSLLLSNTGRQKII